MNPDSNSRSGGREARSAADEADTKGKQATPNATRTGTPRTDMQDADAGTAASGNDGSATAAESVMKQEHKTEHERGSRR
jgi:hypothetical protein